MNNTRRVVITGMGVISPIGNSIPTFWQHLEEGYCGIDTITSFPTDDIQVKIAGEVKDFDPQSFGIDAPSARKNDRFALFAQAAANQAMEDSNLHMDPTRLGVYVGSGIGGMHTFYAESVKMTQKGSKWVSPLFVPMMISNIASGNIAIAHNAQGPCLPTVTACATGTHSIGEAYRAIRHGYAEAIITGGAEAAIHPLSIGGFANSKALSRSNDPLNASLPFDRRRSGFVMAEGAGILVLEEYHHALERGARIYAEVCGYGNTCDAYHYTAPRPDGSCAARAIRMALDEAAYTQSDILYINAHGTGTPLNDASETAAIKLAMGTQEAHRAFISSTKSMTGHALGAAGGIELIASVLAMRNGVVPPTIGLNEPDPECDLFYTPKHAVATPISIAISNSLGFGGHNGCLAIRGI